MGLFLFAQCIGATQLILGFLSEEIVPYVAANLLCPWEEVGSGSSYIAILNRNPQVGFNINLSSDCLWESYQPPCLSFFIIVYINYIGNTRTYLVVNI